MRPNQVTLKNLVFGAWKHNDLSSWMVAIPLLVYVRKSLPASGWRGPGGQPVVCREKPVRLSSNRNKELNNYLVVSIFFYFHPYLGKWSNLTNIFQMGWNHQLDKLLCTWLGNDLLRSRMTCCRSFEKSHVLNLGVGLVTLSDMFSSPTVATAGRVSKHWCLSEVEN